MSDIKDRAKITLQAIIGDEDDVEFVNLTPHAPTHQLNGNDQVNVAGLSGVLADPQNAGLLRGRTISGNAPVNGSYLMYNGTVWIPSAQIENSDATSIQGIPVDPTDPTDGQVLLAVDDGFGSMTWVPSDSANGDPRFGVMVSATITSTSTDELVNTILYTDADVLSGDEDLDYYIQGEYLFSVSTGGDLFAGVLRVSSNAGTPFCVYNWDGAVPDDLSFDFVDNGSTGFDLQATNGSSDQFFFRAIRRINAYALEAAALGPLPVITDNETWANRWNVDFQEVVASEIAEQVTIYVVPDSGPEFFATTEVYQEAGDVWSIAATNLSGSATITVTVPAGIYSNNQEAEEQFYYEAP